MAKITEMAEVLKWHNYDTLTDLFYDGNPSMHEAECAAHAMLCHDEMVAMLERVYEKEWGYGIGATHDELMALITKAKGGKA